MKKVLLASLLLLGSLEVSAGAWSDWAVPTRVDIERGNGVMVYGNFGNKGSCTVSNRVYIPATHPEFDKVYALLLAGFTANKEVQLYVENCQPVGWYAKPETTYNWTVRAAVNIRQP